MLSNHRAVKCSKDSYHIEQDLLQDFDSRDNSKMAKSSRPNRLHPGSPLSEHYQIEGLVRLAERRMFYLANDDRQDQPNKFCWDCGETNTPRKASNCIQCGCSMRVRKFLICMRWEAEEFEHY